MLHSNHFKKELKLENAQSSQNWIGPIQYFSAETDRRFSTDPVLTVQQAGDVVELGYI